MAQPDRAEFEYELTNRAQCPINLNWMQRWMIGGAAPEYLFRQFAPTVTYDKKRGVWTVTGTHPETGTWSKEYTVAEMKDLLGL